MRRAIRVSSLFRDRLVGDLSTFRPTHVVSLLDASFPTEQLPAWPTNIQHLELRFLDGEAPGANGPQLCHLETLIAFLSSNGGDTRLLTHCHMGIGRSTAAAYIAFVLDMGPGQEASAFAALLEITR